MEETDKVLGKSLHIKTTDKLMKYENIKFKRANQSIKSLFMKSYFCLRQMVTDFLKWGHRKSKSKSITNVRFLGNN